MTTLREVTSQVSSVGKPVKLANNTFGYTRPDGTQVVRLHNTDIILKKDGITTFDSGGWRSNTTRERMNRFSDYWVSQVKGQWYVAERETTPTWVPFFDGVTLPATAGTKKVADAVKTSNALMRKKINDFLRRTIGPGKPLPKPDAGDCLYCSILNPVPEPVAGEVQIKSKNTEHLRMHVEENYMHGSLIVNAFRYAGRFDTTIYLVFQNWYDSRIVRRVLRKYLTDHLITN